MLKRFMIWFLKQIGNQVDVDPDIWKCEDLYVGFLRPILDNGEIYDKWIKNHEQRLQRQQVFLDKTICPHTGRSCSGRQCASYRKGGNFKVSEDVPFTEHLIAKLENRKEKECYRGRSWLASCTKGVF